jgi:hypothetical protein
MRRSTAVRRWRRTVGAHRTLVLAAGPAIGAVLGIVINVLTGGWRWWLFALLVVLVAAASLQAVLADGGSSSPTPVVPAGVLSTGLRRFGGPLLGRGTAKHELIRAVAGYGGKRVHLVHGLAGIGTSALVSDAGAELAGADLVVRWVDGTQPATFVGGLREVGAECGTAPLEPGDTNELWRRLERRSAERGWLLIIDGLDDLAMLGDPAALTQLAGWVRVPPPNCAVVITTIDGYRGEWPAKDVRFHKLDGLAPAAGGQLLLRLAPGGGTATDAEALSARLGGHPLALKLAGRYVAAASEDDGRPLTFRAFGAALGDRRRRIPFMARSGSALTAVWERSLKLIEKQQPSAGRFLGVLAAISTEPVPTALLVPRTLRASGPFDEAFQPRAMLRRLADLGMVDLAGRGDEQTVQIHPLVRAMVNARSEVRRHARPIRTVVAALKAIDPEALPAGARDAARRAILIDVPQQRQLKDGWRDRVPATFQASPSSGRRGPTAPEPEPSAPGPQAPEPPEAGPSSPAAPVPSSPVPAPATRVPEPVARIPEPVAAPLPEMTVKRAPTPSYPEVFRAMPPADPMPPPPPPPPVAPPPSDPFDVPFPGPF